MPYNRGQRGVVTLPRILKKIALNIALALFLLSGCGQEEVMPSSQLPPSETQPQPGEPEAIVTTEAVVANTSSSGVTTESVAPLAAVPGSDDAEVSQTLQAIDAEMDALFTSIDQAGESSLSFSGEGWE